MEKIIAILLLCVILIGCSHQKSLRIDTNFGTIKTDGRLLKVNIKL